jgi:hypothetical protein
VAADRPSVQGPNALPLKAGNVLINSATFLIDLLILALFIALLRLCGSRSRLVICLIVLILLGFNSILPMRVGLLVEVPMFSIAGFLASRKLRKRPSNLKRSLLTIGLAGIFYVPLSIGLDLGANLVSRLKWNAYGSSSYNITQEIVVFGPAEGRRRLSVRNGLIVSSKRLECSDCKTADAIDDLWRKDGRFGLSSVDPIQEAFERAQVCAITRPFVWIVSYFCAVEYEPHYGYVQDMRSDVLIVSDASLESTLSDLQQIQ